MPQEDYNPAPEDQGIVDNLPPGLMRLGDFNGVIYPSASDQSYDVAPSDYSTASIAPPPSPFAMQLSDFVNFNPAPEATGGYYTGGLGLTEDDLNKLRATYDYQTAANTIGQATPFEQYQTYLASQVPGNVNLTNAGSVQLNPAAANLVGPTNISVSGTPSSGLPSNIFQGPLPTIGGAGVNALLNLGSAGLNYLNNLGVNQVALGNLPAGNLTVGSAGDVTYPSINALSQMGVNTGSMQTGGDMSGLGTTNYWPGGTPFPGINMTTGTLAQVAGTPATTGATTGNVVGMTPFTVSETAFGGGPTSFGGYQSTGDVFGGGPQVMGPFPVTATPVSTPAVTPSTGGGLTTTPSNAGTAQNELVTLPGVNVTGTKISTTPTNQQDLNALYQQIRNQYPGYTTPPTQLPAVTVTEPKVTTPTTTGTSNIFANINAPTIPMGPFAPATTPATSTATGTQTTATTTTATPTTTVGDANLGLGSLVGTATNVGTGATARNFPAELAASTAALRGQQGNLMGMYGDIYQNLLGQTAIPQAAQQSLAQMQADAAKLQRIQSGQLSAEDVRNATQQAREAYAARGQVMGPGAIGAEILNREAIRQQREDQARAAYQASMGNVFNAAQLQTGNIFSPIGNLVSGTFNPLGAYPQDVYSSNVNAQLARDIAAANNAAAIEAAKYGAAASQKAATTSALGNILGKIVPGIFG